MAGILTPLLALPVLTSRFGLSAWTAIAIGQSVGAASAILVELGWGLNGPQRIARAAVANRRQYLALSIVTKLLILTPAALVGAIVTYIIAPIYAGEAALIAIGTTAAALSSTWYYIGSNLPIRLLLADVAPRIGFVGLATLIIAVGGQLYVYPLVGMMLPAAFFVLSAIVGEKLNRRHFSRFSISRIRAVLRLQGQALRARAASGLYTALPITLVALVNPPIVPLFASAERLQRLALQVLTAFPNLMQHWVGSAPGLMEREARARSSVWANAVLGAIAALIYTLVAPFVAEFVFSGTVRLSTEICAISGVFIFIVCTSRSTGGIALVNKRDIKSIAVSATLGAFLGVPSIILGARFLGVGGALAAEVFAEALVLLYQIRALRKSRK